MPDYVHTATRIAREAGAIIREGYGRAQQVEHKSAIDLVTEFDRRSEALILRELRQAYPGHGFQAEESGHAAGDDYEWLVDPLDGTTNFAHGFPVFSVSLALTYRRRLVAGVVYDPLRDELYTAEAGQGAALNGAPMQVSAVADLGQALLATGFPYDLRTNPQNNFAEFQRFQLRAQAVRRAGSAALDCAWVAAGRLDGYWEYRINPWDIGAGALMVRESGGRVTDAHASDDFLAQPLAVVSNGLIHDQMLNVLNEPL